MNSNEGASSRGTEPQLTSSARATRDNDSSGDSESLYGEVSLTSMKAIEIYQNQVLIVDRLWAYFSQYSGLLVVLGLGLVAFRSTEAIASLHGAFVVLPLLAYIALCAGNHRAMALSLRELQIVRSVAISKTRLEFNGHARGTILRFQLLMASLVVMAYAASAVYAMIEGRRTTSSTSTAAPADTPSTKTPR